MYAILQDRGRQITATTGDRLLLDRAKAEIGETLEMPVALLIDGGDTRIGEPLLSGVKAVCKVIAHRRGRKGIAGTFKRRKDTRRRVGFRHDHTLVEVVSIG